VGAGGKDVRIRTLVLSEDDLVDGRAPRFQQRDDLLWSRACHDAERDRRPIVCGPSHYRSPRWR
jgi:hypothetical protein